ncbi:hypothetical protein [Desmospora activa]|uniref:Acetyltransferase (GNAT) family protein n=1 Tax=Desmospora activa DSM 45169 TaxID=1121389 RepID=A0A2T4Z4L5_9BACL|nr:hypothetical protein [Desmospora activa]PTM56833.1 hypothetical protein C8J48_3158 [Desmospora activa DSM 45169]
MSDYTVFTLLEKPKMLPQLDRLARKSFPDFIYAGDQAIKEHTNRILEQFPEYQFVFIKGEEMIAGGLTVPLRWNGTDDDLPDNSEGLFQTDRGQPNILCALAGLVEEDHQGKGLSRDVLLTMRSIAEKNSLSSLLAPVRPNHKTHYPLVPMEIYMNWRREDGLLFDPWMRVHERLGAKTLRIMTAGVYAQGTVREWEDWTGIRFLDSGPYVIPGALNPVEIDLEKNEGVYIEPNVWMEHRIKD